MAKSRGFFIQKHTLIGYYCNLLLLLLQVVGAVVAMMIKVEVNSPEGALALSKTMGSCMSSGSVSKEKQVYATINTCSEPKIYARCFVSRTWQTIANMFCFEVLCKVELFCI